MDKKEIAISAMLLLLFGVLIYFAVTSEFTFKEESNKTWGQKDPVAVDDLYIYNSSGNHYKINDTNYYYVWGFVGNKAQLAASNVVITAKFYDANGTLIGTNKTTPFKPKSIPSEGKSAFEILFNDPNNITASYKLELSLK